MNTNSQNKWLPENLNTSALNDTDRSKLSLRYHLAQPNQGFKSPKLAKIPRDLTKLPDDYSFNNDNLSTVSRTLRGTTSVRDATSIKRREPYADFGKSLGTTGNLTSHSSTQEKGWESKPRTREYNKTIILEEQPNYHKEERQRTLILLDPQKPKAEDRNKSRGTAAENHKTIPDEPKSRLSQKPPHIQIKAPSIQNLGVRMISPKANLHPPIKKVSPLKSPTGDALAKIALNTGDESEVIEIDPPLNPPSQNPLKKSQTTTNVLRTVTKRFMLAQQIVRAFESTIESNNSGAPRKKSQVVDEKAPKDDYDSFTDDPMQHTKTTLQNMLNSIQAAIGCRKDKRTLNLHLDQMAEIAARTYNVELQLAAMKTQGKIRLIYNDIYRAIMAFKQIKKTADQYKSYTNKLKAYKYLAICFHRVENYKMATFYNIKMLQAAWLCNSKRYELLAYDNIGIEHYYQGDIEKATFYHEKMMAGHCEPPNSKLRQLGINKLLIRMNEASHNAKKNNPGSLRPKKVQEELYEFDVPLSEDDFELPSPRNQRHHQIHEETSRPTVTNDSTGESSLIPIKKVEKKRVHVARDRTHHILKRMMEPHSRSTSTFRDVKSKSNLTLDTSETIKPIRRVVNETFNGPINPNILISHLSPNRLLNNFHPKDTKYIVNAYMARGTDAEDNYAILDSKSLEKIRKKLEKLKENTQLALKRIIQMQQVQSKIKSHSLIPNNESPLRKIKKAVLQIQKV